jgi:hypothetical protein
MHVFVPKGGSFREGNGDNEGGVSGHIAGPQSGGNSVELEQIGWFRPLTQAQ